MTDDRWQMADDKWQMADDKCRMADDKPAGTSGDCGEGQRERSEPTPQECRAPKKVPNEAQPESTQSHLASGLESSAPGLAGRERSRSWEGVASSEWRESSGQRPVKLKRPVGRREGARIATSCRPAVTPEATGLECLWPRANGQRLGGASGRGTERVFRRHRPSGDVVKKRGSAHRDRASYYPWQFGSRWQS